jgi:hypothetical protein
MLGSDNTLYGSRCGRTMTGGWSGSGMGIEHSSLNVFARNVLRLIE